MIVNDYVLMELNQQRRTQVAEHIAALRVTNNRHQRRPGVFRRRNRHAPATHSAATALAFGTGSTAR